MTLYVTVTQIAKTIKKLLESTAMSRASSGAKADLITEFAIQFYPGSPTGQRAFIRQCTPDKVSLDDIVATLEAEHGSRVASDYLQDCSYHTFEDGLTFRIEHDGTVDGPVKPLTAPAKESRFGFKYPNFMSPPQEKRRSAGETEGGGRRGESQFDTCGFCRGRRYITNPDDLKRVPCFCQGDKEQEGEQCCYLRPSQIHPHGDLRRPCTTEAEWGIHEKGTPYDIISYACNVHLPLLLGHARDGQGSFEFEVWPLKVVSPAWEEELLGSPADDDDEGGFYEPNADADYYEERDNEVNYYDPQDAPDSYTEWVERLKREAREKMEQDPHYIPKFDRTGPANDPDFDVDKEFEDMLKRFEFEPDPNPDTYNEQAARYYDEEGTLIIPLGVSRDAEDLFGAADEEGDLVVEGLPFTPEYVIAHREGDKARGSYVGSDPLYEEETDDFCCEIHQALSLAFEALAMVRRSLAIADNELAKEHFNDLAKPHIPGMHKESLACDVCGGGGLTREDDFCYGCGHIVCVSCIVQSGTCGDHTIEDHFPERDLHFVAD